MKSGRSIGMKLRIPKSVAFFFAPLMILLGSLAAYAQEGAQFIPIPVLQFGLGNAGHREILQKRVKRVGVKITLMQITL